MTSSNQSPLALEVVFSLPPPGRRLRPARGPGWVRLAATAWLLSGCAPAPRQGLTSLPLGEDVRLALGAQRLLLAVDPARRYRVTLTPGSDNWAWVSASMCQLDRQQRIDEGDSHCLGLGVQTVPGGVSQLVATAPEPSFRHLALSVWASGPSQAPVTLRIDVD